MKKQKNLKIFATFGLAAFMLSGCQTLSMASSSSETNSSSTSSEETTSFSSPSEAATSASAVDYEIGTGESLITLADDDSQVSASEGVSIDNASNLVTISQGGTYVITGKLSNGAILITTGDEVTLILNGVDITSNGVSASLNGTSVLLGPIVSENEAALNLIVLPSSSSLITDTREETDELGDDTAAIFANQDLKISGSGSLGITSSCQNGLASDASVMANGVTLGITVPNIAVKAHQSLILGSSIEGGNFTLTSTGENTTDSDYPACLRVDEDNEVVTPVYGDDTEADDIAGIEIKDGAYAISAEGKAISSDAHIYLEGGSGTITSSYDKGVKSELDLDIDGGAFAVSALEDDCLHSSSAAVVATDGYYVLTTGTTKGCQGIKGETEVDIKGGTFVVKSSYEGIAAHVIVATGGTTIVSASDDGWSAGGTNEQTSSECKIAISGGYHYVKADGDGLDSNGYFQISGGTTIVAAPSASDNGPLDSGDGYEIDVSGGNLVAYGISGMTEDLYGTSNTVVMKSMSEITDGYFIFSVSGSYYAAKVNRTSTTLVASFTDYGANDYSIYTASSITGSTPVFEEAGFYKITSFTTTSTLLSGSFTSTSSSHVTTGSNSQGDGGGPGGAH